MTELNRILTYIKQRPPAGCEQTVSPPFTCFSHPENEDASHNFALLDTPLSDNIDAALARLQTYFQARGRTPCLHYADVLAPGLDGTLRELGYIESERRPLFDCTPATFREPAPVAGLTIETLSSQSSLAAVIEGWNANARGFDPDAELATPAQAEELRGYLTNCRAFTARLDGQPVGAGMFDTVRDGVAELSGITTLAPFRRRGIAAALTARATQVAFSMGVTLAYLVPVTVDAGRVYERVGYRHRATLLSYSRSLA